MLGRLTLAIVLLGACSRPGGEAAFYEVRDLGLDVPKLEGWRRDRDAEVKDPTEGGVVFRLVREQAVTGSPRIDVVAEKKGGRPTSIDEFVQRSLDEISALEAAGTLEITDVSRQPLTLGPRRAFRVRHEYILSGQAAVTQVSVLVVLDGRGVAVTAVGRTELFLPVATQIESVLAGLRTPIVPGRPTEPIEIDPEVASTPGLLEPIDLGKVGGGGGTK